MLDPSRISYQWTLRQIGAYLDEHSAVFMTLTEIPDGFVVRHQTSPDNPDLTVVHFARRELVSRDIEQEQIRLQMQNQDEEIRQAALDALPPPQVPGGYQDFLRALGYELDQSLVYYFALDEVPQGTIITYLHVDPRHDFMPQKKMVFLRPDDKETILQDAHSRRQRAATAPAVWEPSKIFR